MKRSILIFSLIALTLSLHASGPSSLNTAFNGTGIANILPSSSIDNTESVQAIAMQADGKIIFAGYTTVTSTNYGILGRLHTNGSLDTTFGTNGYVIVTPNSNSLQSRLCDVLIQPDGNIVVVGYTKQIDNKFYGLIARYQPNGQPDTTFNTTGFNIFIPSTALQAEFYALTFNTTNQSIIVTGSAYASSTNTLPMIARFTSTGIADTTFNPSGTQGYTIFPQINMGTNMYGGYNDVALQVNGTIVVTGYVGSEYQNPTQQPTSGQMIVARYNNGSPIGGNGSTNSGQLDTATFNARGTTPGYIIPTYLGDFSAGLGITLQSDQKIIVTGTANPFSDLPAYTVLRLNIDGSLDTTFNSNDVMPGINQTIFNDQQSSAASVIMQQDQQILTTGTNFTSEFFNIVAIRYDQDGIIDPTFSLTTNQTNADLQAYTIAVSSDKTIIVAGVSFGFSYDYNLLFYDFLGGTTPALGITSAANAYGYNSSFLSEFLYINFYAQLITNPAAQADTIAATNSIINSYVDSYSNQPEFNYIAYLYLMNAQLLAAQTTLTTTYSDTTTATQITLFFTNLMERENQLLA